MKKSDPKIKIEEIFLTLESWEPPLCTQAALLWAQKTDAPHAPSSQVQTQLVLP